MPQSPSTILQEYLRLHEFSPQEFSHISGMPESEIRGLLESRLTFTALRANHLAAVFNTNTEIWLADTDNEEVQTGPVS